MPMCARAAASRRRRGELVCNMGVLFFRVRPGRSACRGRESSGGRRRRQTAQHHADAGHQIAGFHRGRIEPLVPRQQADGLRCRQLPADRAQQRLAANFENTRALIGGVLGAIGSMVDAFTGAFRGVRALP